MKACLIYLLLLSLCSSSVWAQEQAATPEQHARETLGRQEAKIRTQVQKRGIGEQSKVKVLLKDKMEVKGYISKIDADSFQVTHKKNGEARTISYGEVEKVRGPGLSRGAKIAIAVVVAGALAGGLSASLPKD
jgi:hypothetical protein